MLAGGIPSVREPLTSISAVDEDIASSGEAVAEIEALFSFRYGKRKISQSLQSIRSPWHSYPTAMVELDTRYFIGKTKVLCMDNPVQDIIIGNIPGASGVQPNLVNTKATVTSNKVDSTQVFSFMFLN